MSEKEPIRGKHDEAHHEGRRGALRRLFESDDQMIEFLKDFLCPELWEAALKGELTDDSGLQDVTENEKTSSQPP